MSVESRRWRGRFARVSWAVSLSLLLGLGAGWWMGRYLPWGAWARTDSVAYIQAAYHVTQGKGLVVYDSKGNLEWLAHFPPFYPLTLAAWMEAGLVWHQATRWDSALAYGLFVALLALTFARVTRRLPETLAWTAALGLMPPLVQYFAGAMSEGWFYVFLVLTLYGWWRAMTSGSKGAALGAGLSAGLAVLTRYAGLFLVGGVVFLLWGFPGSRKERGFAAGLFLGPILTLYGLWHAIMRWAGVGLKTRMPPWPEWIQGARFLALRLEPIFWQDWLWLRRGEAPASAWLYTGIPVIFVLAPGLIGLGAWWWLRRRPKRSDEDGQREREGFWPSWSLSLLRGLALWIFLWGWSTWGYIAFIYLAHMLREPPAAFYGRVMSPVLFLGAGTLMAAAFAFAACVERWLTNRPVLRPTSLQARGEPVLWLVGWWLIVMAFVVGVSFRKSVGFLTVMRLYGNGYTRKMFHDSEFWSRLQTWPEEMLFISTEAHVVSLWTGRFVAWPSEAFNPSLAQGPLGSRENDPWHRAFREGKALFIHIKPALEMWWEARMKEEGRRALETLIEGLPVCWDAPLGTLYFQGPADAQRCPHRQEP